MSEMQSNNGSENGQVLRNLCFIGSGVIFMNSLDQIYNYAITVAPYNYRYGYPDYYKAWLANAFFDFFFAIISIIMLSYNNCT